MSPIGFKPDDTQGKMFDKTYYGLKVPSTEDYDAMNENKLGRREVIKGSGIGKLKNLFLDGFHRINPKSIPPSVQDQYNDAGKVKPIYPSCTATGFLKKKHKKRKY